MKLFELVNLASADTISSLKLFGPELTLCVTIFVILAVRVIDSRKTIDPFVLTLAGLLLALVDPVGIRPWQVLSNPELVQAGELFTGMLAYDAFTVFMRSLFLLFAVLFVILTKLTRITNHDNSPDFYCLVLGATLGFCLMASANHLLVVFLAVEMASVPSYVLAGLLKGRSASSEAALKYSVYGAGAAGIMLYGISLIAGLLNTVHLPTIATRLTTTDIIAGPEQILVLVLAGLMIMVGLAFKLSAVPFHFWCPDVFEGASAEVGAFLSVASKAAALALLVRIALGFGTVGSVDAVAHQTIAQPTVVSVSSEGHANTELALYSTTNSSAVTHPENENSTSPIVFLRSYIALLVAFISVLTCTLGNMAAYGQTNIKRLLAYSTIAHAGYMMMALPAALSVVNANTNVAQSAIASLVIYLSIYLFMNLGAFAVVAFLRNALGSEEIADYAGLVRKSPGIVICFSLILFSLVGIPPLAGFVGKFAIFAALVDSFETVGHSYLMVLLIVGGLNTAISLFYYLRVVKVMVIDEPTDVVVGDGFSMASLPGVYLALVTAPLLLFFVRWEWLSTWASSAARQLLS